MFSTMQMEVFFLVIIRPGLEYNYMTRINKTQYLCMRKGFFFFMHLSMSIRKQYI